MTREPRRMPEQIGRLLIVFTVFIGGVLLVRTFAVPAALKETGQHRTSTIERELAKPVRYGGSEKCQDCHEDEAELKAKGYHRTVACETCHGPLAAHIEAPLKVRPSVPQKRDFCPLCHAFDPSRPTGFPQINPTTHNPVKACTQCHKPHDPRPPEVPRECGACHAEIARTKSLSPHALLACTTCHTVPEEHKVTPHSSRPTKPTDRVFCGTCHGKDSTQPDAPKIDVKDHGGKYLCWQCHYPHSPEAGSWIEETY